MKFKQTLINVIKSFSMIGIDVYKVVKSVRGVPDYISDLKEFKKKFKEQRDFDSFHYYPCLWDRHANSGVAEGHYFHQDLYVAQKIHSNSPEMHVDVGSRIDGFVAHVAAFRKVYVIDIRELKRNVENIEFLRANLLEEPPVNLVNCTDSLSCLHALEHFGLGRYGDPMDLDGHEKGFENLLKILKPNGIFYLSVPIGQQRIEFNAHRVFSVGYLLRLFESHNCRLEYFSYVDDKGDFHREIDWDLGEVDRNFGCNYGCGIFVLRKSRE